MILVCVTARDVHGTHELHIHFRLIVFISVILVSLIGIVHSLSIVKIVHLAWSTAVKVGSRLLA